jgi:hypothetical protein
VYFVQSEEQIVLWVPPTVTKKLSVSLCVLLAYSPS